MLGRKEHSRTASIHLLQRNRKYRNDVNDVTVLLPACSSQSKMTTPSAKSHSLQWKGCSGKYWGHREAQKGSHPLLEEGEQQEFQHSHTAVVPFQRTNSSLLSVSPEAAALTCLFSSHYCCQFLTGVNCLPWEAPLSLTARELLQHEAEAVRPSSFLLAIPSDPHWAPPCLAHRSSLRAGTHLVCIMSHSSSVSSSSGNYCYITYFLTCAFLTFPPQFLAIY